MPERLLEGIQITETPGAEQPIARASAHLTAFVGRTLRGPIDRPVQIHSFADFQQEFGGLWQPSPLSYAVEHFFETQQNLPAESATEPVQDDTTLLTEAAYCD